jgi:hypothetical protein
MRRDVGRFPLLEECSETRRPLVEEPSLEPLELLNHLLERLPCQTEMRDSRPAKPSNSTFGVLFGAVIETAVILTLMEE